MLLFYCFKFCTNNKFIWVYYWYFRIYKITLFTCSAIFYQSLWIANKVKMFEFLSLFHFLSQRHRQGWVSSYFLTFYISWIYYLDFTPCLLFSMTISTSQSIPQKEWNMPNISKRKSFCYMNVYITWGNSLFSFDWQYWNVACLLRKKNALSSRITLKVQRKYFKTVTKSNWNTNVPN